LIVDDHEAVRASLKRLLQDYDFDVVADAADGAQGIALAKDKRPDVVVMDLSMPVMNGIEATRMIRQEPNAPDVIVLTGYQDATLLANAADAGAFTCLVKGNDPGLLVDTIRHLWESRNAPVAVSTSTTEVVDAGTGALADTGMPSSGYPDDMPDDVRNELELYPRAKERFLSKSVGDRAQLLAYVEEGEAQRRHLRIMNVVMSLDY